MENHIVSGFILACGDGDGWWRSKELVDVTLDCGDGDG